MKIIKQSITVLYLIQAVVILLSFLVPSGILINLMQASVIIGIDGQNGIFRTILRPPRLKVEQILHAVSVNIAKCNRRGALLYLVGLSVFIGRFISPIVL